MLQSPLGFNPTKSTGFNNSIIFGENNVVTSLNHLMKSKLLSIIYFLLPLCLNAQREADCIIAGNSLYSQPDRQPPGDNFIIKYNADSLESIDNDSPYALSNFYSRAAYSDKYGNFKFACNNWRLVNSLGEVLSYKLWRADMAWPGGPDTTLVDVAKGPLFLNDPGDSTKAYLFYGQYKTLPSQIPGGLERDIYFTYAYLDVTTQQLISKNNIVLTDTTSIGDMMAVRHGNGRDWWLIKPGLFTNIYYIGLISPTGISPMQRVEIPGLTPKEQTYTSSFFSQDGNTFVHCSDFVNHWIQKMYFDRCEGQFYNPVEYDFNELIRNGNMSRMAISPDASKCYFVRVNYNDTSYLQGIYQYDFDTGGLYYVTDNQSLAFLSPNFKEIMVHKRINNQLSSNYGAIKKPNELGTDCNYVPIILPLINFPVFGCSPNFANFRLGPLDGSICDSLGIDNPVTVEKIWEEQENKFAQVFPNPFVTELNLRLQTAPQKPLLLQVHNTVGQLLWQSNITQLTTQIPIAQWSKGLYLLRVVDENGKVRFVEKVVRNE